jgi:hypothetical protein
MKTFILLTTIVNGVSQEMLVDSEEYKGTEPSDYFITGTTDIREIGKLEADNDAGNVMTSWYILIEQ